MLITQIYALSKMSNVPVIREWPCFSYVNIKCFSVLSHWIAMLLRKDATMDTFQWRKCFLLFIITLCRTLDSVNGECISPLASTPIHYFGPFTVKWNKTRPSPRLWIEAAVLCDHFAWNCYSYPIVCECGLTNFQNSLYSIWICCCTCYLDWTHK